MAKKKDREAAGEPADRPVEMAAPPAAGGGRPGVVSTGYDYSGWGPNFSVGSRPPAKTDWDAMSPEQRAAIGLPDWDSYKTAAKAWRANFQPGGGNFEFQTSLARDIANSGASSWDQIARVLASRGIINQKEQGQALYRRLQGAFQGTMDPTGRFHRTPDGQWVDVGTSDLAKRGIPGRADYHGDSPTGIQGVLGGLGMTGGKSDIQQFQDFVAGGHSSIEGTDPRTGLYYNKTPDGRMVYYDKAGYQVDPSTGQTLGHYVSGASAPGMGAPGGGPAGGGGFLSSYGRPSPSGPEEVSFGGGGSFSPGGPRGDGTFQTLSGGSPTGGAFDLQSMTPKPGGFWEQLADRAKGGTEVIHELPPGTAPGGSGSIGGWGGIGPGTPGDTPFSFPWGPADASTTPFDVSGVGAWQDPRLMSMLMGQSGLDLGGQQFQLDRAMSEFAGAQPIEQKLTGLYSDILGGGGDAGDRRTFGLLAPEVNRMMGDTDAMLERFKTEAPIGGERASGIADILKQSQGNILGLRQGLQQQAIGGLTDIMNTKKGFNPAGYSGAGQALLGDLTSRRGQDVGMRGQDLTYGLGQRGQDLDFSLGSRGQDLQRLLGMMGDSTQRRGQDFDFSLGMSGQAAQERMARLAAQQQEKQRKSSWWQSLLGTAGGLLGGFLSDRRAKQSFNPTDFQVGWGTGMLSDAEMKENVGEFKASMKDLRKLPVYSYTYREDSPENAGEKHIGVMAQDLQKIAPDAVAKGEDGYLRIKPMALLALTMNSVKNLDARLTALTKKREK